MTISNLRTREEWLDVILRSGQITRIGQHLALVIYHLSDPATNTAKLSARDLERITGWSRTAIIDHLSEIEVFIRVTWGAGRAKSLFELQGVITQVLEEQKAASQSDTTAAIADTTEVAATVSVQETAISADTKAATTACGQPDCHSSVSVADTNVQKTAMGGTIGGENNYYPPNKISLSPVPTQAPDWRISEDGGFEGQVYELSGADYAGLQQIYEHLDWPAEIVAADYFFAREFGKAAVTPQSSERMARLHQYLAKKNRDVRELRLSLRKVGDSKAERKIAPPAPSVEPPSCWFDDDARLQVANGFKVDLLEAVGGDEIKLREELDKAAGYVGVNTKGPQLMAKVRSRITVQAQYRSKDQPSTGAARRERLERVFAKVEAEKMGKRQ